VLTTEPALAQAQQYGLPAPSPTMGELVAQRMCAFCHAISPGRPSEIEAEAPSFMEIAKRPGRDAAYLRAFANETHLVTSAGNPPMVMPTAILTAMSREDVVAYILSLKDR
jgi:cytochrome c2